jgi:hypothetical protein
MTWKKRLKITFKFLALIVLLGAASWGALLAAEWVGLTVVVLLFTFGILWAVYAVVTRFQERPESDFDAPSTMPVLRPLAIPTKDRRLFMRILVWLFDVRHWKLVGNWYYRVPNGPVIVLHDGFKFDGASIPRPLWFLLNPIGLLLIPGLVHDYGYRYGQLWQITRTENGLTIDEYRTGARRKQWDALFFQIGRDVNGTALINFFAYLAVWLGGRGAWRKNRREAEVPDRPELPADFDLSVFE